MKVPYLVPKVPSHYLPISKGFDSGINVTGFTLHLHSISIIFGRQEATNEILTSQPQTSIDREACLII